jgi:sialic acid synthase SpsE
MKNNYIEIQGRKVGPDYPPFVIVEIGINHEGDINKAKQMVIDAKKAGAECVKFQSHVIDDEMVPSAKSVIPGNAKESIYEIMERCVLNEAEEKELMDLVKSLDMIYMCTPFSRAAADRLKKLDIPAYKIGSGECNNYPLIKHIAGFGKPVIISTGMNDIKSIEPSVEILRNHNIPYALLHCTSMYPTPYNKVRLGALKDLEKAFPDAVLGLSDHSLGNYTCFGSVALGASILEKHFTSDKSWPGPDIEISITPEELKDLVDGSNAIFEAAGGSKEILSEEQVTIDFAYASIVSIKPIKKGELLSMENIWVKRPGTGEYLAKDFEQLLGKKAAKDIDADIQISSEDLMNDYVKI